MATHRLIIDGPAPGAWNMAVDEALLADAAESGIGTLRFYQWDEPTLSLGYFQAIGDRVQHPASLQCACVRRQTGGGAILHDRELTYSLVLPGVHSLARQTEAIYNSVHDAFIEALQPLVGRDSSWAMVRRSQESIRRPVDEPFLCFQRQARGDVLLTEGDVSHDISQPPSEGAGWKILGSAQRRHRGAVLQHGSLLLAASPAAPELPGVADLTGICLAPAHLANLMANRLENALELDILLGELPSPLQSIATQLANTKYGGTLWTNRR